MKRVGFILGSKNITPLEFWVGVEEGNLLQMDDFVFVKCSIGNTEVKYYGVVVEVYKYWEGVQNVFETQLAKQGVIPVNVAYIARVNTTRIEPEYLVPPSPGDEVFLAEGEEYQKAIYADQMKEKIPAGITRSGNVVYINYHFLNGKEGAHVNISGMSGVATKTSYALFLLYSIIKKSSEKNIHGIIFNVKGKDLLWIDKENKDMSQEDRQMFMRMGLDAKPFSDVIFYVPPDPKDFTKPSSERMDEKVVPFRWSMRDFAEEGLLKFMFAEGDEGMSNLHFVIDRVMNRLYQLAKDSPYGRLINDYGSDMENLDDLEGIFLKALEEREIDRSSKLYRDWFGSAEPTTVRAFMRRFQRAKEKIKHLVGGTESVPIEWEKFKVSVIDISSLHNIAKMFVVGSVLKKLFKEKEDRASPYPKVFVLLDELNKYAPREGWSPIKDVLLEIAERGRSLGVLLIGAQQTASEVEKRIVANSAVRVLGRIDSAEVQSKEYDFLTGSLKIRAMMLKKGTMIIHQPDIPTPVVVRFPKPPWATRKEEVKEEVPDVFSNFDT